jgi:hypothetical protein
MIQQRTLIITAAILLTALLSACGGSQAQASCLATSPDPLKLTPKVQGPARCAAVASNTLFQESTNAPSFAQHWQPGANGWVTRTSCVGGGSTYVCHVHMREQTSGPTSHERVVQYRTNVSCTGSGPQPMCRVTQIKYEKLLYSGPAQNREVTNP